MFRKLINYLSGARQEVKKINWPTSQEVVRKTTIVILFSTAVTIMLGGLDFLFNRAILNLVTGNDNPPAATTNLDSTSIDVDATDGQGDPIEIQVGDEEAVGGEPVEIQPEDQESE